MSDHTVTLSTEELVAAVGALVEAHRVYMKGHERCKELDPNLSSPYLALIAYTADAYAKLNALLPAPRSEVLRRTP